MDGQVRGSLAVVAPSGSQLKVLLRDGSLPCVTGLALTRIGHCSFYVTSGGVTSRPRVTARFQRTSLGAATLSDRFHPPDVALTPSAGNQRRTRTRLAGQRPRRVDCPRDTQWDKSGDVQEEDLGADRSGDAVRRLPTCSSEAASVFIGAVLRAGLPSSCAIPSGSSWSHRCSVVGDSNQVACQEWSQSSFCRRSLVDSATPTNYPHHDTDSIGRSDTLLRMKASDSHETFRSPSTLT
ncbi:hypothetical protein HPB47_027242 [Ixodes persulcatus]|uniref:Uncharacterized protein n=1 Tax=Ixodes persulcatus TaxID=34615 RepID=A0AC60PWE7_IXOPE|nr:hypothetical protein HPB47_027242 [Ixodes persulcatus]